MFRFISFFMIRCDYEKKNYIYLIFYIVLDIHFDLKIRKPVRRTLLLFN